MKIGYFADGPWSHESIKLMVEDDSIEIAFIVPRFDTQDPVLKSWAEALNIPFLLYENVNSKEALAELKSFDCDLFVSMSFNQIIKRSLIDVAPKGFINCHAGALPFYRGRNPLNWVLINGEKEFGITVHYIDEGIDTGDVVEQELYPITDIDTYATLLSKAINKCGPILLKSIKSIQNGSANRIPQSVIHPVGTYFCQRKVGDEFIDFNWTASRIFNFVRALTTPGPLARFRLSDRVVHVEEAFLIDRAPTYISKVGEILEATDSIVRVKAADTVIDLKILNNGNSLLGLKRGNVVC